MLEYNINIKVTKCSYGGYEATATLKLPWHEIEHSSSCCDSPDYAIYTAVGLVHDELHSGVRAVMSTSEMERVLKKGLADAKEAEKAKEDDR